MAQRHLFVPQPRPDLAEILLAVGPMGYGATFWRSVASLLPKHLELRAVRLPGRESRFGDAPYLVAQDAAGEIVDDLLADPSTAGRRVSIVGLCSGATIAFEAARELARRGATGFPDRLVLADRVHPSVQPPFEPIHSMASTELFARLVADDRLPPDVVDDPAVFALFEATWRADLELIERYGYAPAPPLSCSIVAIAPTALHDGALRWAAETNAAFQLVDAGPWAKPLSSAPAEALTNWLIEAMDAFPPSLPQPGRRLS